MRGVKIVFEMVDASYEAGVEMVKYQIHVVEDEMSKGVQKLYQEI